MTEQNNCIRRPVCVPRLSAIAGRYDAFLIDQWGVLHDGNRVYDGVAEVLRELSAACKPVLIVTNSAKTRRANIDRLDTRFSISAHLYRDVVSSADVLLELIEGQVGTPWDMLGRRVFLVADGSDDGLLDGSSLTRVTSPSSADFILLLSVPPGETMLEHQEWINEAAARRLLVACPSADLLSVSVTGVVTGLSSIVRDLRAKGGRVLNVGKPERPVYDVCKRLLPDIQVDRILAVGDQIGSDCAGANRHGIASALVCTGAALDTFPGSKELEDVAEAASRVEADCVPAWVMPSLRW